MRLLAPVLAILIPLLLLSPRPDPTIPGTWYGCFRYDQDSSLHKCGTVSLTETPVCRPGHYHGSYRLSVMRVTDSTDFPEHRSAFYLPPDEGLVSWERDGQHVTLDGTERAYGAGPEGCVLGDVGLYAPGRVEGDSLVGKWDWWAGYGGPTRQGTFTFRKRNAQE